MVRVTVVGSGYVGTVTAACLAWLGHEVVALESSRSRVTLLSRGTVPFYEPQLEEKLQQALSKGCLSFTADPEVAYAEAQVIFLCVGTPAGRDGQPDMSQVASAVQTLAQHLRPGAVVVNKSTVPVGSGNWVRSLIEDSRPVDDDQCFSVISNPEFLREGMAVGDFLHPDRIVLGCEDSCPPALMELYEPVLRQAYSDGSGASRPRLVVTTLTSAEMVKYGANAFLANKISFANEIANICELVGADAREVLPAIGADERIGPSFLGHGIGWGGSCFGKDVAALIATGLDYGYSSSLLRAVIDVNQKQRGAVVRKLQSTLKVLKGRRIALLGLAFKPGTDDVRDAPAIDIIKRLTAAGALVTAYDPAVHSLAEPDELRLRLAPDAYQAARRVDAVVVTTEWPEFRELDLAELARCMRGDLLLDGRSIIDADAAAAVGIRVIGFGW
jgi:nucleotide sugar dehydrogenase